MAAGDFTPWTVYYKAVADFSDLLKEAAKARAEMAALTKDIQGMSKGLSAEVDKAATAEAKLVRTIDAQRTPLSQTALAAKNYDRWVLWGGRDNPDAYQRDLQRETQLLTLLNRARQRGFYSPQMDYAFRQREYQQLLLWNRAMMLGYNTPEQFMTYQVNERKLLDAQTQAWKDQAGALEKLTSAAEDYSRITGKKLGVTQDITGQTDAANKLASALSGIPDQVITKMVINTTDANSSLDNYQLNLSQTPEEVTSTATFRDSGALAKIAAYKAALAALSRSDVTNITVAADVTSQHLPPLRPETVPVSVIPRLFRPDANWASKMASIAAAQRAMESTAVPAAAAEGELAGRLAEVGDAATMAAGGGGGGGGLAAAAAAAGASGDKARGSAYGWGRLLGQVSLFGGATFISGWHLAADALIEFAAVAVPAAGRALAGLASYVAAAYSTYSKAYSQLKSQMTVTGATGFDMPPFAVNQKGQYVNRPTRTTRLDFVAAKVQPDVLQQMGMAVQVMHTQGNLISQLATSTGGVLDRFSAKLVYDFQHNQGAISHFMAIGAKDLEQFGHIAQNLGTVFMNFVKASQITHIAEDLLAVVAAITRVAAAATSIVGPWGLAIAIGTHAAFVYGGLLATGFKNAALAVSPLLDKIGKLPGPFSKVSGLSYEAAKGLGATDAELAKVVAREPGIQAVASATGKSSDEVAKLEVAARKAGTTFADQALQTTNARNAVAKYGASLDEAGKNQLAMAAGLGASDEKLGKFATSMVKTAESGSRLEKITSRVHSVTSGLASYLQSGANKMVLWGGIIAGAAVVYGVLAKKILTATDATDRFLAAVNKQIAAASIGNLITALAKGMGEIALHMPAAQHAVTGFNEAIGVSAIKVDQMLPGLGQLGGDVLKRLASSAGLVAPAMADIATATGNAGGHLSIFQKVAHNMVGTIAGILPGLGGVANKILGAGAAAAKAEHDLTAQANAYVKLSQQTVTYMGHAQQLGDLFGGSISKGLAAATQAGLTNAQMISKNAKTWGEALIQVKGLIEGYKLFGQQAGALGNDINVVTYAQSNQLKQMQALNSAWDTFTGNVAAPRTNFIAFAQSLQTFNADAKKTGAAMTGLGSNALTLQSDFQNTYGSANSLLDSLRIAATPARQFTAVVKEMVQGLLPMAQHSKAARAEISVLAQEAGGPATTHLKTLSEWAGKTAHPIGAIQDASNKAVIAMSHLSNEAKLVSNSINNYFVQALTVAELKALGFQKAVEAMVYAQQHFGTNSVQFQTAMHNVNDIVQKATSYAQKAANAHEGFGNQVATAAAKMQATAKARQDMIQQLENAGINSTQAQNDLANYTDAVLTNGLKTDQGKAARQQMITDLENQGMSAKQANALVDGYTKIIKDNQNATSDAHAARAQMISDFQDSGHWSNQAKFDLNAYTIMVQHNKETTAAGKQVRQDLIDQLRHAGLNAQQARRLVDELTNSIHHIPDHKATHIAVDGQGKFSVSPSSGAGTLPHRPANLGHHAQGGVVDRMQGGHIDMTAGPTMGPHIDTVDAKLRPGEYVVKTEAVQKYGRGTFEALNNMAYARGGMVAVPPQHLAFGGEYENPLRRAHVYGERIDMGVDYGGSGPLMFVGPGRVTSKFNSGWPGGAFIAEQLTAGPYAGRFIYEAEDITPSGVHVGQMVGPNTVAGYLHGQMEIGWAAPPGTGETMAARFGQQSHSGDPGAVETAFGANFNQFMGSLGAIKGIGHGAISGRVPKNWGSAMCTPASAKQVGPVTGHWGPKNTIKGLGRWAEHEVDLVNQAVEQQIINDIVAAMSCGAGGGLTGPQDLHHLESLWIGAGGPGGMTAHIAAAIALAESGGNPQARNPSGASGLWQILGQVVPGNIFNPQINAENAVKKWRDAHGFSPWVTYTDGAYRHYMAQGGLVPGLAAGGTVSDSMFSLPFLPPGPFTGPGGPTIRDPKPQPGGLENAGTTGHWAKAPGNKSIRQLLGPYLRGGPSKSGMHDDWLVKKFGLSHPLPRGIPYWVPKAMVLGSPVPNPGGIKLPPGPFTKPLNVPPGFHCGGACELGMAGGGLVPENWETIGHYLMDHGYDRIAAAGVLGNIFQESRGNPEAGGPGNGGIIQWTPAGKARPLQPIMTGHPDRDLQTQLVDLLAWNKATTNLSVLNKQKSPQAAALYYMRTAERPGIPMAATREASAAAVYKLLHGKVQPGGPNLKDRGKWAIAPGKKSLTALLGPYLDHHDKWLVKKYGRTTALPKGTRYWEPADFVAHQAKPPVPNPNPGGLGRPLPPGSNLDLGQQWQHNWDLLQIQSSLAERAFMALDHAMFPGKWFHSKKGLPTWHKLMGETSALKPPVNTWATAWGQLASDQNAPDLMTTRMWANLATDASEVQKQIGKSRNLKHYATTRWPAASTAASRLMKAYAPAYKSWLALYGPTGRDRPAHFPATPHARLIEFAHPVPTPNIAALLPALPEASFAAGGLVGMGSGLMAAPAPASFGVPVMHRADGGGVSVPEAPRAMSAGAQASGGDRVGMQINGGITINNPVQEKAGESLTRSVNRLAFFAGRGVA